MWRVVVAIPMGVVAATILANLVPYLFGVYNANFIQFALDQPSGRVEAGVWLVGAILFPLYLVRYSPSVRETFRRSLPLVGYASLFLDIEAIIVLISGVRVDPNPNAGALDYAIFSLVLLAPLICPVLYYWVVPSESQRFPAKPTYDQSDSARIKWPLTALVLAGAVAACGLAVGNPALALFGIVATVAIALVLIWSQ
jgi:hypothetical protein